MPVLVDLFGSAETGPMVIRLREGLEQISADAIFKPYILEGE